VSEDGTAGFGNASFEDPGFALRTHARTIGIVSSLIHKTIIEQHQDTFQYSFRVGYVKPLMEPKKKKPMPTNPMQQVLLSILALLYVL